MSEGNGSSHANGNGSGNGSGNGKSNGNGKNNGSGKGWRRWKRPVEPNLSNDSEYDEEEDRRLLNLLRRLQGLAFDADPQTAPELPATSRFEWPPPPSPESAPEPAVVEPPKNRIRLLAAAELKSPQGEKRELVTGLLAAGQPSAIFGALLTLKSTVSLDLAMSIATGTPFLGQFAVPEPGRVVLFSEESLSILSVNFRRIRNERRLSLAGLDNLTVCHRIPQLDDPLDVMALQALVATRKLVCVVIDSTHLAFGKATSHNASALSGLLQPLQKLCESSGCTILLVHSCKRSRTPRQPATLEDVAWKAFSDYASQWLLLSRRREFDPETGRHELWLSSGNRSGRQGLWALDVDEHTPASLPDDPSSSEHSAGDADGDESGPRDNRSSSDWVAAPRGWKTTVRAADWAAPRADARHVAAEDRRYRRWAATRARHRQRVLELLVPYPEGRTANAIRDVLGLSGTRMREILVELVNEGLLTTAEVERGKRTDILYRRVE